MTEFERTYLAKIVPPEIHTTMPLRIIDIYIPDDAPNAPRAVLRLRRNGDNYEITKKTPISDDLSIQTEQTIPLTRDEFESLMGGHNRRIEKDRYDVTIDGRAAQVDVFSGGLDGLVVIDFEFSREADKDAFEAPDCCLVDVTQERFIAGGELAGKTYEDIRADLERLDYQPLTS